MDKKKHKRLKGRPLKFKNSKELAYVINKYFKDNNFEEYSVTGLALCIGSKQLLADYGKRPKYKDIVAEAKLIIEHSYELSLRKTGGAHNIFALKNFGWADKIDMDVTQEPRETLKITFVDNYGEKVE